jgi:hypothetical protein
MLVSKILWLCLHKHLFTLPKDISPKEIEKIEAMLESYESASSPMDRHKFAEAIIRMCRERA